MTFTAVVTSQSGPPPDGETVSLVKGKTVLETGSLSGGMTTFTTSSLKVGKNSIKAEYSGDGTLKNSNSKPVVQVVN